MRGWAKRGDFSYNLISPRGWWACRWRPKRARVVGGVTAITPFTRRKSSAAWCWGVVGVAVCAVGQSLVSAVRTWRGESCADGGGAGGVEPLAGGREVSTLRSGHPCRCRRRRRVLASLITVGNRRGTARPQQCCSSHTSDALATSCDVVPLRYCKARACL